MSSTRIIMELVNLLTSYGIKIPKDLADNIYLYAQEVANG